MFSVYLLGPGFLSTSPLSRSLSRTSADFSRPRSSIGVLRRLGSISPQRRSLSPKFLLSWARKQEGRCGLTSWETVSLTQTARRPQTSLSALLHTYSHIPSNTQTGGVGEQHGGGRGAGEAGAGDLRHDNSVSGLAWQAGTKSQQSQLISIKICFISRENPSSCREVTPLNLIFYLLLRSLHSLVNCTLICRLPPTHSHSELGKSMARLFLQL